MKLSTGKVAFPIEFDNGDKATIYFNPNDPDLMVRMKGFEERISEKIKEISDIELSNEGTPIEFSQVDAFDKVQMVLKNELDYAFGGSISDVVFKYCSPFAIVDGDYFVTQFLRAITPEVEKHIKKANERMSKHIDKYKK